MNQILETINIDLLNKVGIIDLGCKFCPIYEEVDNDFVLVGTDAMKFDIIYNKKLIRIQNRFDKYIQDKNIQDCLSSIGVDPIDFWYVLLFIYDYSWDICNNRISTESLKTPLEQIEDFIQNLTDEEQVELILKSGKKKLVIDDSATLHLLKKLCSDSYEKYKNDLEPYSYSNLSLDSDPTNYCASDMAYMFCDMLKYYFSHIVKRSAGAKVSNIEKELLSYLLYFTGISKNKNLLSPKLNDYNTVKGLMNPKKKPDFSNVLNVYRFRG